MIETYSLKASQDPVVGEYQQLLHWTMKGHPAQVILIQILLISLFVLLAGAFSILAIHVGKLPDTFTAPGLVELGAILGYIVAGILVTSILHEWVHGLTIRRFGARPHYGVLWRHLMFYATSTGYGFRRNSYILIALAP